MRECNKNYTATAKSLHLAKGPSRRAASVVPLLDLTTTLEALSPKRPYSADCVAADLASSQLFKQMLSEPIRSWRNNYTDDDFSTKNIEATSVISLASGCYNNENNGKTLVKECELLPGLVTKPPLPPVETNNKTDMEKIEKSPPKENRFQHWINEENAIESEILLSERRTDRFFDDLKKSETPSTPPPPPPPENHHSENCGDYGDVLGSLDDLTIEDGGSVGRQSSSSGIVEDNGTYDDIVTLLKVLEDQDKKSRTIFLNRDICIVKKFVALFFFQIDRWKVSKKL